MSQKKKKNANYQTVAKIKEKEKLEKERAEKKKNLIIAIVSISLAVLLIGGIIAGIIFSSNAPDGDGGDDSGTVQPYGIHYVEMDFGDYGKVTIKIDGNTAPITAKNFMELVSDGFYDGLTIFRAQENFVIQGGKDDSANLKPIVGEFSSNGYNNTISHLRGVISMARTNDPNSATSQFFITLHDQAKYSLDGAYAAFGYVVEGMEVVDAIAEALYPHATNSMGFVDDDNAVTIVSVKKIDYQK